MSKWTRSDLQAFSVIVGLLMLSAAAALGLWSLSTSGLLLPQKLGQLDPGTEFGIPRPRQELDLSAVYLRQFPDDWPGERTTEEKQQDFFALVGGLARVANQRLRHERTYVKRLFAKKDPTWRDRAYLRAMFEQYEVPMGNRERLLFRLDEIPVSMVLAQAAVESAWGTSRFAREGNALFGEWTWDVEQAMIPKRQRKELGNYGVRKFGSLYASLNSYFHNLNTSRAYKPFRKLRAKARAEGRALRGRELAQGLTRYSEKGGAYVSLIHNIIDSSDLSAMDEPVLPN